MNGVLLTRLSRYSCAQLQLFNENPQMERSNKSKVGDEWRKSCFKAGHTYYKGGGFLKEIAVSFLVDEVHNQAVIVHKMVTEDITNDYDKRWMFYVGAVIATFSGDLLPTKKSSDGSLPLYIPREAVKGYLHLGLEWYEIEVTDRAALLEHLRDKHFAAKDRASALQFDADKRNTYAAMLESCLKVTKTQDPRG